MKDNRIINRYRKSLNLKVLSEIIYGKYTITKTQRVYEIGIAILYGWIKKYSKLEI